MTNGTNRPQRSRHEGRRKSTHGVLCSREVQAQVRRGEPHYGQLADTSVLQLRLSEEVDGDPAGEPDGVEANIACVVGVVGRVVLVMSVSILAAV